MSKDWPTKEERQDFIDANESPRVALPRGAEPEEPFTKEANQGIVGLAPSPWSDADGDVEWPTEGYDGQLSKMDWEGRNAFEVSGHTREEWLALGDEMIRRWTEWRAFVQNLEAK